MGSSLLYSLETDVTDYSGQQGFLFSVRICEIRVRLFLRL